MEPREHLEKIVRPNMDEMRTAFGDVRRAFNAVAAVDALAAHIYWWICHNAAHEKKGADNDSEYRDRLAQKNFDFQLVRDIAKAQKHVRLTRGSPQVPTATHVATRSLGWDEAPWDEGRWDSPPQVVVTTNADQVRVVESILQGALGFLESEMKRLGIP